MRPASLGTDDRCKMSSTMLLGLSVASELSRRNLSDHATSGRNTKKFVPTTRITMTTMAIVTWAYEPSSTAAAM